jgi:hypothetical protein
VNGLSEKLSRRLRWYWDRGIGYVEGLRESGKLLRPLGERCGYLGFTQGRNLGDDACRDAASELMAPFTLVDWNKARIVLPKKLSVQERCSGLMLGGGTLIGRYQWLDELKNMQCRLGGNMFSIGVGVEDPDSGDWHLTSQRELERWVPTLLDMDYLSVRGERSAEILRGLGVGAIVSGDIALGLHPRPAEPRERILGICMASPTDGMWGGTVESALDTVVGLSRRLIREGWMIHLYLIYRRADGAITRELMRRIDNADSVRAISPTSTDDYLNHVGEATVFIGMRLHSVVLASVAAVPSVALAYRPKCEEFMESIGRSKWSVRTSALDGLQLMSMLEEISNRRDVHSAAISSAVSERRTILLKSASEVRQILARR